MKNNHFGDNGIRILSSQDSFKVICIESTILFDYILLNNIQIESGKVYNALQVPNYDESSPKYLLETDLGWIRIECKYFMSLEESRNRKLGDIGI